jgi:hypothetical protein
MEDKEKSVGTESIWFIQAKISPIIHGVEENEIFHSV